MAGNNVENMTLELLRAIRGDVAALRLDTQEVKARLTTLESTVTGQRRDTLAVHEDVYRHQAAYDRLLSRVERIEQRLDLHD